MTTSIDDHSDWIEITIRIHPIARESTVAFLFDLGCTGVVTQDLQDRTIKAYLPSRRDPEDVRSRIEAFLEKLKGIFPEARSSRLTVASLESRDWSLGWRKFFRAERVTPDLLILPAWEPVPPLSGGHLIRKDPGPAFGTGQHATTRMCLEAMEKRTGSEPWNMLDVGTGSGILAIYAAKLGASGILGVDIDPEALRWAERNIVLNGLSGTIQLSSRPLQDIQGTFSMVTANLVLGTILDLLPHLTHRMGPGGDLILSGILRDQVAGLDGFLKEQGLCVEAVHHREEWRCILARKGSTLHENVGGAAPMGRGDDP